MAETMFREILSKLIDREDLSRDQTRSLFSELMDGELNDIQIAGMLMALATKDPTVEEIAGAADAMRAHAIPIDTDGQDVIDIVGTGGTGLGTFNISTTCCFVVAGAGGKVAKHGNITNTRPSGSANVLEALGVNIQCAPEAVTECIRTAGVGFCFARSLHPAMKYAAPARKQLPVRTIFNILGPLTNPAGAKYQVMGVYDAKWLEPLAEVLGKLGLTRAMVVHSEDGLDEISIATPTDAAEWKDGMVRRLRLQPEDVGLSRGDLADIIVDSPEDSAKAVRRVLSGEAGARRNIVVFNAGVALAVLGLAKDFADGVARAQAAIDSGAAHAALDKLIEVSHG